MIAVKTRAGYVTSYSEAWRKDNRPVWTWRIDAGEPPHDFGSTEAAWAWINEVWEGSTVKERLEADWSAEVLS